MTKPFELSGVEVEKAEAMRRYNIRRAFQNTVRLAVVAPLCYLWFPTVVISVQTTGDWFYRTGVVIIANRSFVFVVANLIVGLIFLFSRESNKESGSSGKTEPDLYDQYTTSSSTVIVTAVEEKVVEEDDDSKKQNVPAFIAEVKKEVVVEQAKPEAVTKKGIYRRTKSETTKKKIVRPVMEFRRTESAKVVAIERLNSEEFRLKVESFIMEKKRSLVQENNVVYKSRPWLNGDAAASGYGSC